MRRDWICCRSHASKLVTALVLLSMSLLSLQVGNKSRNRASFPAFSRNLLYPPLFLPTSLSAKFQQSGIKVKMQDEEYFRGDREVIRGVLGDRFMALGVDSDLDTGGDFNGGSDSSESIITPLKQVPDANNYILPPYGSILWTTLASEHFSPSNNREMYLEVMKYDEPCEPLKRKTDVEVTLISHTTMNRFWILRETCSRWGESNDFIIVVYYTKEEYEQLKLESSLLLKECKGVQIKPFFDDREGDFSDSYPVNTLRNIGLSALTTSHYLMLDIDFLPSAYLHELIDTQKGKLFEDPKQTLIVPAFQRQGPDDGTNVCDDGESCRAVLKNNKDFIPHNFKGLEHCLRSKDCIVFQYDNNPQGHSSTNTAMWVRRVEDGVEELKCFDNNRYEPYLVVRHCKGFTPLYDERFYGYGKNKIEMIAHLRHMDYKFSIINKAFIVHFPHPESKAKEGWLEGSGRRGEIHYEMDKLYAKFVRMLKKIFGRVPNVPLCEA